MQDGSEDENCGRHTNLSYYRVRRGSENKFVPSVLFDRAEAPSDVRQTTAPARSVRVKKHEPLNLPAACHKRGDGLGRDLRMASVRDTNTLAVLGSTNRTNHNDQGEASPVFGSLDCPT